ncbi:MAG: histidine phosphatase family protein [Acidimicrobiales bacterium]|nr:histidine phosphatase family protein [Hyphomonadaceae bacterium]RZV39535.1 MAG: histidine phosphatase family protein [Acidimicrobiales bacterium]
MQILKYFSIAVLSFFAVYFLSGCGTQDPGTTVYIVRHAEKVTTPNIGRDPDLTEAGHKRAKLLAEMLADKNISHIHSSDYIRNRDTAKPLADKIGVEIEIYDPSDLKSLATKIQNAGGSHLVVGHSNTIVETVEAFHSEGGTKVSDDEYDRLYTVRIGSDAKVKTELTRFGPKYIPADN